MSQPRQFLPTGRLTPRLRATCLAAVCLALGAAAGCGRLQPAAPAGGDAGPAARGSAVSATKTSPPLEPVSLLLNWFPEAEHGGFYTALVDGLYRRAGLDVTILPGGPNSPVAQRVARGEVDFGVSNADNVLFIRAQQAPVVAVMAPLQTSPRCIMVHRARGIHSFDDLRNVTLAMSSSGAFSFYLRLKAPLENVRIVPYSGSMAAFLRDPHYAQQAYVFSEPFVAKRQGADPRCLMLADLGFNPYASLLITNEKTIADRPELVRKMVAASVAGWRKYLQDPAATNRRIHELNPLMDLDVLTFGAEAIKPLALGLPVANSELAGAADAKAEGAKAEGANADSGKDQDALATESLDILGQMTPERWQTLADQLVECGQLKPQEADPKGAFTTDFLPANKTFNK